MVTDITMDFMTQGVPEADDIMRVVMFYGTTCKPCSRTMPNYETVADYYTAQPVPVLFYRIDAWNPPEQKLYCEQSWGIEGVPTFKVFLRGEVIHESRGGKDAPQMFEFMQQAVDEAFKRFGVRI